MRRIFTVLRNSRGQSIVEFALILPFLLVLIGGIVDFGLAFFAGHLAQNGAREGARTGGALPPADVNGDGRPDFGNPTFPAGELGSCTFPTDCLDSPSNILRQAALSLPNIGLLDGFTITAEIIDAAAPNQGVSVTVTGTYAWFLLRLISAPLPLLGHEFPDSVTISRTTTVRWEWQPVT